VIDARLASFAEVAAGFAPASAAARAKVG
jgi:hypothetical protein